MGIRVVDSLAGSCVALTSKKTLACRSSSAREHRPPSRSGRSRSIAAHFWMPLPTKFYLRSRRHFQVCGQALAFFAGQICHRRQQRYAARLRSCWAGCLASALQTKIKNVFTLAHLCCCAADWGLLMLENWSQRLVGQCQRKIFARGACAVPIPNREPTQIGASTVVEKHQNY